MRVSRLAPAIVVLTLGVACGGEDPGMIEWESITSELSASARRARAEIIRDIAAARGLDNGALLGGIGDAETGLAHCWSEATWACQGPHSVTCGGPVIAGAGDGPCALREGGLGLFQFDGGTFDQTLARDGEGVLLLEGNVDHAVDFVLTMVVRSQFIEGVDNAQQALAFINSVPVQPGDARYEAWVSTVTRYYNGCSPTSSCWASRRGRYGDLTAGIFDELGADFWRQTASPPPEPCAVIPPEGRVIEEDDRCYSGGGAASGWRRVGDAGSGGALSWTYATASARDNFGVWSLDLAEAGTYRVEVYSDGGTYFQSKRAMYSIVHAGMTALRSLDQTSGSGFLSLGEYEFAAGTGQSVTLGDDTGEPYADRVRLGFDALRLVRVVDLPEPVAPASADPALSPAPTAGVSPPSVTTSDDVVSTGRIAGGCQSVGSSSSTFAIALVALAWNLRRRRRPGRPCTSTPSA